MKNMTRNVIVIFLALVLLYTATCSPPRTPPCPVTAPNGSTPPGEQASNLNHGNGKIWTVLWPEGVVRMEPGGPGEIRPNGSLVMKFPWWRGEGLVGALQIEGKRLDGEAPPLQAEIPAGYSDTGFQASGLVFPSDGCWQVTARAGQAELTIVTQAAEESKTGQLHDSAVPFKGPIAREQAKPVCTASARVRSNSGWNRWWRGWIGRWHLQLYRNGQQCC